MSGFVALLAFIGIIASIVILDKKMTNYRINKMTHEDYVKMDIERLKKADEKTDEGDSWFETIGDFMSTCLGGLFKVVVSILAVLALIFLIVKLVKFIWFL